MYIIMHSTTLCIPRTHFFILNPFLILCENPGLYFEIVNKITSSNLFYFNIANSTIVYVMEIYQREGSLYGPFDPLDLLPITIFPKSKICERKTSLYKGTRSFLVSLKLKSLQNFLK